MNKQILINMKPLKATSQMMKIVAEDVPKKEKTWQGREYEVFKYGMYIRCVVQDEILRVALFFPKYMRLGGRMPAYELFCSKRDRQFITYDHVNGKWRTAKLDLLDWPHSCYHSYEKWINKAGEAAIRNYLGGKRGGYEGVLDFQREVRNEQLEQRHIKETSP